MKDVAALKLYVIEWAKSSDILLSMPDEKVMSLNIISRRSECTFEILSKAVQEATPGDLEMYRQPDGFEYIVHSNNKLYLVMKSDASEQHRFEKSWRRDK